MNSPTPINPMNPLATELNAIISKDNPHVLEMLSEKGKNLFFPTKGIVSQSAEASAKADKRYNATIGIAMSHGTPIGFKSLRKYYHEDLANNEIFSYSPSPGNKTLRNLWKERLITLNPALKDKRFSLPVVTSGLTHAIFMAAELFVNRGDTVIIPDQLWGNYRLLLSVNENAKIKYYPFYKGDGFNLEGFRETIFAAGEETGTIRVILNFPNNPTGYAPTRAEAEGIASTLREAAEKGFNVIAMFDEAYFGLFFDSETYPHSIFSLVADAHERLLAMKICGATKELFAWGLRVGFLTFAVKNGSAELYHALEQKAGGNLRGSISNCSTSAQNVIVKALSQQSINDDFKANFDLFQTRVEEVKRVLAATDYSDMFTAYPFNSGYFMVVKLKHDLSAETVRQYLLEHEKIGVIATSPTDVRIAFSCLETEDIAHVFDTLYKVCQHLHKAI